MATIQPELSVIIVNYNLEPFLETCLESIAENPASRPYEVIVVDNSPDHAPVERICGRFERVVLLKNPRNVGYARAVNQGMKSARGGLLLILNPDVRVRPGSLDALVDFMVCHPRVGIAGAKLLNSDGTLQASCRRFYDWRVYLLRRTWLGKLFPNHRLVREHLMQDYDHEHARPVDWVIGACMAVRREAVDEVGLLDERFFLYFEDVDWCYRMKKRGWQVYYVPQSVMIHEHRRESATQLLGRPLLSHLSSVIRFNQKWSMFFYTAKRTRRLIGTLTLIVSDLVGVNLSFLIAYILRSHMEAVLFKPILPLSRYTNFLVLTNVVTIISFAVLGLYRRRREVDPVDLTISVAKGLVATWLILMASTYLMYVRAYSRAVVTMLLPLAIGAVTGGRIVLRRFLHGLSVAGIDVRRGFVFGRGEVSEWVRDHLIASPSFEFAGWSSDEEILRSRVRLEEMLREERIDELFLAGTSSLYPLVLADAARLEQAGTGVHLVPDVSTFLPAEFRLEKVAGMDVISPGRAIFASYIGFSLRALHGVLYPVGWLVSIVSVALARRAGLVEEVRFVDREGGEFRCTLLNRRLRERWRVKLLSLLRVDELWQSGWVIAGKLSLVGTTPLTAAQISALRDRKEFFKWSYRPSLYGEWRARAFHCVRDAVEHDVETVRLRSDSYELRTFIRSLRHPFSLSLPEEPDG